MSHELLGLYQKIWETPALAVDFPSESGKGRIVRLDTGSFSLSSWNMEFHNYQRQIIDVFINSIYVFDDKLAFTYNFHDGTETITLKEIEAVFGSDLSQVAPPGKNP